MNFADFGLGTWHPKTGMYDVVAAIEKLSLELGVTYQLNANIEKIIVENNKATALVVNGKIVKADVILRWS